MRYAVVALVVLAVLAAVAMLVFLPVLQPAVVPQQVPLEAPPGYVCLRTAKAPNIDGNINDDCWTAAPWSGEFQDIEGSIRPKPTHRTRFKMLWDDQGFYLAAEIIEPHVWATITQRDAVMFYDNDFEVFFSPDDDTHAYAEIELNALNTLWDLLLTKPYIEGGLAFNDWNITGFQSAVKVQGTLNDPSDIDTGWTIEMFWPWKNLQELNNKTVPPQNGSRYRMNMSRVEWDTTIENGKYVKVPKKPEHNWVWAPTGVIDIHRPHRWGYVVFTDDPKQASPVDPAWSTVDQLYDVRHRQAKYLKKHGNYASTLAELGLSDDANGPAMQSWPFGVVVSSVFGGKTYTVRPDGFLQVK